MATKAVKEAVERYAENFRPFYGKRVQIQISNSKINPFASELIVVRPATLEMMKGLVPDQREKATGGFGTPSCFVVQLTDGDLFFALDDITHVAHGLHSIRISIGNHVVSFVEEGQ